MVFECKVISQNDSSEIFHWNTSLSLSMSNIYSTPTESVTSNPFYSNLDHKIAFTICISKKCKSSYYNDCDMKVGLRKTNNLIKCDIRAMLIFEIRNSAGELYLKDSFETQISQSNSECFSDLFDLPKADRAVIGRAGNIYFRNGTLQIKGKVFLQDCTKNAPASLDKNFSQLQKDFKDSLLNKVYADVVFDIESEVIRAHKNVLSSRSIVFKKMFEQDMKEKENIVKIIDIEKSVFNVFLIFLYTGEIEDKKLDVIMPLYSVADKYAVNTLFKTCSHLLNEYISDTSVAPILKLADMHNDATLKEKAVNFICKNFAEVEATESWNTLLNSDPRLTSYTLKQVATALATGK